MAKQDWSPKKSELFATFATAINKKYEDKFDLNDEQINSQLEDLYDSLPEEWVDSLESNPEETTTQYLKAVQEQQSEEPQYAKKGAKLNYMEKLKKGKKVSKKKCKCGCEMEDGGKVCKCCGGGTLQKHQQGGLITTYKEPAKSITKKEQPKGMATKDWVGAGTAGALATTSLNTYLPQVINAGRIANTGQKALTIGRLALPAAQSMLPAIVGETGVATLGTTAAGAGTAFGAGMIVPALLGTAGVVALAGKSPAIHVEGSGNVYNPRTGAWQQGTRDINYNRRSVNYEAQPTATNMNQRRTGSNVDGKWSKDYIAEHASWNEATQATAKEQEALNRVGAGYKLAVNNRWDNATREAHKNFQTEILKPDIVQERSNTNEQYVPKVDYVGKRATFEPITVIENAGQIQAPTNKGKYSNVSEAEKVRVRKWQAEHGMTGKDVDGIWGAKTQALYEKTKGSTKLLKGGKVVKGQKGLDTDETWEPDDLKGLKKNQKGSMNPKDWINSKEEVKKPELKPKVTPKKETKPVKKEYIKTAEKGGFVLIKKNTNGTPTKPKAKVIKKK